MIARLWLIMMSAAVAAMITLAQAQNSEYEALPKPAAAPPPPAPAVSEKPVQKQKSAAEIAAERKAAAEKLTVEKRAAAEKAAAEKAAEKKNTALPAEKEPSAQKKGAALNAKEKEEDIQLGRRMAPSAAIPPFPGDEKGPKTIEFLGACPGNFDHCMDQVREIGEKLSASELCIPQDLYFATVTDRVRKWATLRPDIHGLPAGRVIAAALKSIYPCKQAPARTAAEKAAPKAAKTAQ